LELTHEDHRKSGSNGYLKKEKENRVSMEIQFSDNEKYAANVLIA
jgi:hypothetical protein